MGLLLDYRRPVSNGTASDDVPNLHLDDIAAAQLAIDRQVEQRPVPQSAVFVEEKAYRPHVAWFQRPLRAHHVASVPRPTLASVGIKVGDDGRAALVALREGPEQQLGPVGDNGT